jgi:MFS family permease
MLGHRAGLILPILAILYCVGFTNLFLRSSFGVMAPGLQSEMGLSPAVLSLVASAFFFSYALMQVPTGVLLDRFGARLTLGVMLIVTTIGAGMFAAGQTWEALGAGRLLMGFGCAGVFTGAFYVLAQWLRPSQVVSQIGVVNGISAIGVLCATTPLAFLISLIGWRQSYWVFTAGVGVLTIMVLVVMREAPPGAPPPASRNETVADTIRGVRQALAEPGMPRLLVVGVPMSTSGIISGAWGAPYLKDVHQLGDIERGNVLLAMAVCGIAGHMLFGQAARRLGTMKWPIAAGAMTTVAATAALATVSKPSIPLVAALFCLISLTSAYPTVAHSHARGLVSARLMGRGVSLTNMGIMTGIAVAQLAFGAIIGFFPEVGGVWPEVAYRSAFAIQAAISVLAIVLYVPIRDVSPGA